VYKNLLFHCLLIVQLISSDTPLIIRSSKTVADSDWQPQTYVKPEAAITVFEFLMMSGVSLEIC
jgi:hypothetical protein